MPSKYVLLYDCRDRRILMQYYFSLIFYHRKCHSHLPQDHVFGRGDHRKCPPPSPTYLKTMSLAEETTVSATPTYLKTMSLAEETTVSATPTYLKTMSLAEETTVSAPLPHLPQDHVFGRGDHRKCPPPPPHLPQDHVFGRGDHRKCRSHLPQDHVFGRGDHRLIDVVGLWVENHVRRSEQALHGEQRLVALQLVDQPLEVFDHHLVGR